MTAKVGMVALVAVLIAGVVYTHRPRVRERHAFATTGIAPAADSVPPAPQPPEQASAPSGHDRVVQQVHRGVALKMKYLRSLFGWMASPQTAQPSSAKTSQEKTSQGTRLPNILIIDRPITFDQERKDLTLAYRRQHQDSKATDINIAPRMIILHHTAINSFDATWKYFNNVRAEAARKQLANAGDVNVSAHFVVDRDGTIYRLMPETWMARHCIGLNHVAIGIENVGDGDKFPLTDAQVNADAALVRYLAAKYPAIEYLIGHQEYRKMEGTPLFLELDPKYRNQKPDPGTDFLNKVHEKVKDLKLKGPPE